MIIRCKGKREVGVGDLENSWGLDNTTNSEVEALVVLQGLITLESQGKRSP
jgi:hypothetical protein